MIAILTYLFVRVFVVIQILPFGHHIRGFPRVLAAVGLSYSLSSIAMQYESSTPLKISLLGIVSEILYGIVIGAPVRLCVEAAFMVGELVDTARGNTIGSVQDPLVGPSSSHLAVVLRIGAFSLFLGHGGMEGVVLVLARTLESPSLGNAEILFMSENLKGVFHSISSLLESSTSFVVLWLVPFVAIDFVGAILHRVCSTFSFGLSTSMMKLLVTFLLLWLLILDGADCPAHWMPKASDWESVVAFGGGSEGF